MKRLLPLLLLSSACADPPPPPPPPAPLELSLGETHDVAVGRLGLARVCVGGCDDAGPDITSMRVRFGELEGGWIPDGPGRAWALLPNDVEAEPGPVELVVELTAAGGGQGALRRTLEVAPVEYPTSRLRVRERYLEPPEEVRARIERERKSIRVALEDPYPVALWSPPFVRPVEGQVTSPFGALRLYNNKTRKRHRGLDLDGRTGDPIVAIAAGRVALVEERYYSGGTVVLDHGQGLYSLYFHMSAFAVRPGDLVAAGQRLGDVGRTGRVTGPHLHLSLKLGDRYLDPRAAMQLFAEVSRPAPEDAPSSPPG